jgi:hypothetical protein
MPSAKRETIYQKHSRTAARADRHQQSIDHRKEAIGETKRTIASSQSAVDASNRGFVKRMDQLSASFDELRAQEAQAEGR